MKTVKHPENVKEFIEAHLEKLDKETLLEYGSTAFLLLSGLAGKKIVRSLLIGAVVVAAGKMAYDYIAERAEEADAA